MMWNIVSDSSCDLRMAGWDSPSVRFETVPLRIQVGTREFLDDDNLMVPDLLDAMAAEKSAASSACPSPAAFARAFEAGDRAGGAPGKADLHHRLQVHLRGHGAFDLSGPGADGSGHHRGF